MTFICPSCPIAHQNLSCSPPSRSRFHELSRVRHPKTWKHNCTRSVSKWFFIFLRVLTSRQLATTVWSSKEDMRRIHVCQMTSSQTHFNFLKVRMSKDTRKYFKVMQLFWWWEMQGQSIIIFAKFPRIANHSSQYSIFPFFLFRLVRISSHWISENCVESYCIHIISKQSGLWCMCVWYVVLCDSLRDWIWFSVIRHCHDGSTHYHQNLKDQKLKNPLSATIVISQSNWIVALMSIILSSPHVTNNWTWLCPVYWRSRKTQNTDLKRISHVLIGPEGQEIPFWISVALDGRAPDVKIYLKCAFSQARNLVRIPS